MLVARYRLLRLRIEACPEEAGSTVRASCCLLDRLYASKLSVQKARWPRTAWPPSEPCARVTARAPHLVRHRSPHHLLPDSMVGLPRIPTESRRDFHGFPRKADGTSTDSHGKPTGLPRDGFQSKDVHGFPRKAGGISTDSHGKLAGLPRIPTESRREETEESPPSQSRRPRLLTITILTQSRSTSSASFRRWLLRSRRPRTRQRACGHGSSPMLSTGTMPRSRRRARRLRTRTSRRISGSLYGNRTHPQMKLRTPAAPRERSSSIPMVAVCFLLQIGQIRCGESAADSDGMWIGL